VRYVEERTLSYFLHEKGYTFFTEGKLTFKEVNALIEEESKLIRERKRQQRLAKLKRKR
jgi:hypothetical protein